MQPCGSDLNERADNNLQSDLILWWFCNSEGRSKLNQLSTLHVLHKIQGDTWVCPYYLIDQNSHHSILTSDTYFSV